MCSLLGTNLKISITIYTFYNYLVGQNRWLIKIYNNIFILLRCYPFKDFCKDEISAQLNLLLPLTTVVGCHYQLYLLLFISIIITIIITNYHNYSSSIFIIITTDHYYHINHLSPSTIVTINQHYILSINYQKEFMMDYPASLGAIKQQWWKLCIGKPQKEKNKNRLHWNKLLNSKIATRYTYILGRTTITGYN